MKKITLPTFLLILGLVIVGIHLVKQIGQLSQLRFSKDTDSPTSEETTPLSTAEFLPSASELSQPAQDQALRNLQQEIDQNLADLNSEKNSYLEIRALQEQRLNQAITSGTLDLKTVIAMSHTNETIHNEIVRIENEILELQLQKVLLNR